MPYYAVTYEYTEDADTRGRVRPEHRAFLGSQENLLASGPTGDGDGALLVFEAPSAADVEKQLDDDPYARAGLIASRSVTAWDIVLGRWSQKQA
jgi:uncharacterized protein YciI